MGMTVTKYSFGVDRFACRPHFQDTVAISAVQSRKTGTVMIRRGLFLDIPSLYLLDVKLVRIWGEEGGREGRRGKECRLPSITLGNV